MTLNGALGSSTVSYNQGSTGAATITQQAKNQQVVSVLDFYANGVSGALVDPTGVLDSTGGINAWLSLLSSGVALEAPEGTFKFTSAISIPAINGIRIKGRGRQKTKFIYSGANTTNDLWTIGDGTTSFTGLNIEGFNIDSTTTMTAGNALHIKYQQSGSQIRDVSFSNLNATKHLWSGIWFDNTNVTSYQGFEINAINNGLMVSGSPTLQSASDLYIDGGAITYANTGLLCGGSFGGLYVGELLLFGNLTNVQIDTSLAAKGNRELMFSQHCISDGCKNYGFYINDALASGSNITLNAFIGSAGLIGVGGVGNNIKVANWASSRITIGSGQLFNATGDCISISDASTLVTIGSATQINNTGWGLPQLLPPLM